jgi:UrcA family protein
LILEHSMSATQEWLSHAGFALLAGVVLSAGASAAFAGDRDPFAGAAPVSIRIHASSADLTSPRQAKALAVRLRAAAATVCGGDLEPFVRTGDTFATCREAAIDHAVAGLNAPLLSRALGRTTERFAREGR